MLCVIDVWADYTAEANEYSPPIPFFIWQMRNVSLHDYLCFVISVSAFGKLIVLILEIYSAGQ